jgi:hypothetical protein
MPTDIYSYEGKCNLCGCNAVLYTYTDYVEGAPWESVSMVQQLSVCLECFQNYVLLNMELGW